MSYSWYDICTMFGANSPRSQNTEKVMDKNVKWQHSTLAETIINVNYVKPVW